MPESGNEQAAAGTSRVYRRQPSKCDRLGLLRPAFSTVLLPRRAPRGYIFSFQPIRTSQALTGQAVKKPRIMESCIIIQ